VTGVDLSETLLKAARQSAVAAEVKVEWITQGSPRRLTHSAISSPIVPYRDPFILYMPAETWFNVKMIQQYMLLVMELCRQVERAVPTNKYLTATRGMGWGSPTRIRDNIRRTGEND
jgi:hypothetical protein